jgi:hypothetical protein
MPVPETPAPKRPLGSAQGKRTALKIVSYAVATLLVAGACLWTAENIQRSTQESANLVAAVETMPPPPIKRAAHLPLPAEVRGVYVTASTASSLDRYTKLISSVKAKGANAVVLDLKAEKGSLAFVPKDKALRADAPVKELYDLEKLVAATHELGLYLIARMPVFEDPDYAETHQASALSRTDGSLWRDAKGLYWLDPAAESVWEYNADIAKEAYDRGCDEIQFDYIRFATDGKTSQIVFPYYDAKRENMRGTMSRLFGYFERELRGVGIPISIDVFGFVTWHQTDLGIGQWYMDALASFDAVSPMVYPSHYPSGTLGFKNPASHPYEIVADSLKKGGEVISQMQAEIESVKPGTQRPWLQAFNMGAIYTPEMISAQIKAARDNGASGFLLWNAGNNYSSLPDLTK